MLPQYSDFVGDSTVESWSRGALGKFGKRLPEVRYVPPFLLFILFPLSLSFLLDLTVDRCGAPDVIPVAPGDTMSIVGISFGVWQL